MSKIDMVDSGQSRNNSMGGGQGNYRSHQNMDEWSKWSLSRVNHSWKMTRANPMKQYIEQRDLTLFERMWYWLALLNKGGME